MLDGGNVIIDNPIGFELLGQLGAHVYACLSDRCCCVYQVREEYVLDLLLEDLLAKLQAEVAEQFKDGHSDSPLAFRSHSLQMVDDSLKLIHADHTRNFMDALHHIELDFFVHVLDEVLQNGQNLLSGVVFSDKVSHLGESCRRTSSVLRSTVRVIVLQCWQK